MFATAHMRPDRSFDITRTATLFVVFVLVAIVLVDGLRTQRAREIQLQEGEVAATNLARSIAQHASDSFRGADAILIGLVDRIEASRLGPHEADALHALLVHYATERPELQRLTIIDAAGTRVATSTAGMAVGNVADRDYFKHHLSHADAKPFVGPTIRSLSSNQWIVTVSRRIARPDGGFGGVALASIDLAHFNRFFAEFDIGSNGAVALATLDGRLLDRRPFVESAIGSDLSGSTLFRDHIPRSADGLATIRSPIDGIERQVAFRKLRDFPLVAFAALATEDTLAEWRGDAVTHSIFVAVLVLALAVAGTLLVRQIGARAAAQKSLRESQGALESLNGELARLATTDALTGLPNRRAFDRRLEEEIGRVRRSQGTLSVMLCDVDHFKAYNDLYGHVAGDECLRRVGAALGSVGKRPADVVARYGGEEFALILPDTGGAGATQVARSIGKVVRELQIAHGAVPRGYVTISVGVVTLVGDAELDATAVLRAADSALYDAKAKGRDTVAFFGPDVPRAAATVVGESTPAAEA